MYRKALNSIVEEYLYKFDQLAEISMEQLADKVALDYLDQLKKTATIPFKMIETIQEDLKLEALEIVRIRTYGFSSLREFQKQRGS